MKIHSNFKDYYDYVEYIYSPEGGDKSLPFYRNKIDRFKSGHELFRLDVKDINLRPVPRPTPPWAKGGYKDEYHFPWSLRWCVVCGKYYLLVAEKKKIPWEESTTFKPYRLIHEGHPAFSDLYYHSFFLNRDDNSIKIEDVIGVKDPELFKLSKLLKLPTFVIQTWTTDRYPYTPGDKRKVGIHIQNLLPNLGHLGFAGLIPPERMYQELSMFMGSVLREPPDNAPPVNVSDNDRLVQKGFDLKVSFRGKVK